MKGVGKIATTGIWKIEKRLDNVIDYTTNIEKNVPIKSGLGDKSSIIAGFLVGRNEIYHTNLSNLSRHHS